MFTHSEATLEVGIINNHTIQLALPEISRRLGIRCDTTVKPVLSGDPVGMAY